MFLPRMRRRARQEHADAAFAEVLLQAGSYRDLQIVGGGVGIPEMKDAVFSAFVMRLGQTLRIPPSDGLDYSPRESRQ